MMGTAAINEYSAATLRFAPRSMPPMIVAADREKPGQRARHWNRPIPSASPGVISSSVVTLPFLFLASTINMSTAPTARAIATV